MSCWIRGENWKCLIQYTTEQKKKNAKIIQQQREREKMVRRDSSSFMHSRPWCKDKFPCPGSDRVHSKGAARNYHFSAVAIPSSPLLSSCSCSCSSSEAESEREGERRAYSPPPSRTTSWDCCCLGSLPPPFPFSDSPPQSHCRKGSPKF